MAAKTPHSHVNPELTAPRPKRLFLRATNELSISDSFAMMGGDTVEFIVRSYEIKQVEGFVVASTKSKHSWFTIFTAFL